MQIVIDISEEVYNKLLKEYRFPNGFNLAYPIIHGTPLPKGHGRLIDADALASEIKDLKKSPWYKDNTNLAYLPRKEAVDIIEKLIVGNASTIIEADKDGEPDIGKDNNVSTKDGKEGGGE